MMDPDATFNQEVEWISIQYSKLEKAYKDGMKLFNEKVMPYISEAKLLELISLSNEYDQLMTILKAS